MADSSPTSSVAQGTKPGPGTSSNAQDNPNVPKSQKAFIPLENNPEVMTTLIRTLGVSRDLSFHDVFSIDDADLLSFVPRPAYALLLVFPISPTYETFRRQEDSSRPEYSSSGPNEEIIWFKQTIRNACGLIGLLHAICNGPERSHIQNGSDLAKLLEEIIPLLPEARAESLYNSKALESAHQKAAKEGDTLPPEPTEDVDLHYVCFVKSRKTNRLWELDGRRKGPIDRGVLEDGEDVLSEKALELGVRQFLKREAKGSAEGSGGGEMRFSLVVLGPSLE